MPVKDGPEGNRHGARSAVLRRSTARSGRIFFGWTIVACSFSILCVAYGIQFSFGLFLPEMSAEMGWNRSSLSLPYSVYVFVYGSLGMVTGRLTDRWGPRAVLMLGGVLLGSGISLMSRVGALWHVYVWLGLVAAAGMSATFVPCNATVVRWFVRRRGLALGVSASGASLGNFSFPPLAAALISALGWRRAYLVLGLGALALLNLLALPIVRDPERVGLKPDGADGDGRAPAPGSTLPPPALAAPERTLVEARRTSAFWMLTAIFGCTWLVVFLPLVHLPALALDLGVPAVGAALTVSVIGAGSFAGRLATGPLSDRAGRKTALGICLAMQVLAFLGFALSTGGRLLYPAAGLFGIAYGGTTVLFPAIVGDYFGRGSVGAIVGFMFGLAGSMAAFGPAMAGLVYDATGRYTGAFLLSACLNGLSFLILLALERPPVTEARPA